MCRWDSRAGVHRKIANVQFVDRGVYRLTAERRLRSPTAARVGSGRVGYYASGSVKGYRGCVRVDRLVVVAVEHCRVGVDQAIVIAIERVNPGTVDVLGHCQLALWLRLIWPEVGV